MADAVRRCVTTLCASRADRRPGADRRGGGAAAHGRATVLVAAFAEMRLDEQAPRPPSEVAHTVGDVHSTDPTTTADPSEPTVTRAEAGGLLAVAVVTVVGATQTDYVAPILAFVATLVVAILTAFTTSRRQTRQLAEDARRQERVLDAERGRLEAQLTHDRQMADVADLRNVLDDAATTLQTAYSCSSRGSSEQAREILAQIRRQSARLSVRVGSSAPITNAIELAGDAFDDLWIYRSQREPSGAPHPAENGQKVNFYKERKAFETAALQLAGTRLDPLPGTSVGTYDPSAAS